MNHTKVLVLTGGPCSGKSSAKAILMQKLPEIGIVPVFVSETATLLLGSGIDISKLLSDPKRAARFQELVLEQQIVTEATFARLAALQENTVVICDRGAMDGAAYVDHETFGRLLSKLGYSKGSIMSRYDGVVHLVTAADGAADFYDLANPARYESPEDAVLVDKRLQSVWSGHPALRIVSNKNDAGEQIDFGQKMDQVVREICNLIGIPVPVEKERKFLIHIDGQLPPDSVAISITQTYLKQDVDETERRVRIWQYGAGDALYFYTEKKVSTDDGLSRIEFERQIDTHEYIRLLSDRDYHSRDIRKTRICFVWNNQYFEVDKIESPLTLSLVEVQANSIDQAVSFPDWIHVVKEVTTDVRYKNSSIAAGTCPGYFD